MLGNILAKFCSTGNGGLLLQEKVGLGSSASDTGKGKSKMSKNVTLGYHLVKGKSSHPMEDYVVAEFKQVEDNELGLFAIFDGHLSHNIPDYLRSNLFVNILNEVLHLNICISKYLSELLYSLS